MDPTAFICGLMRKNTDALGFIPETAIQRRFVPAGNYVIQHNRHGKAIGYLVHGPVDAFRILHVHQTCIELDRRNRGFGQAAVKTLIERATRHQARRILLKCAADLEAIPFWISTGFLPTHVATGGRRRQRKLVYFELDLTNATPEPSRTPAAILAASVRTLRVEHGNNGAGS